MLEDLPPSAPALSYPSPAHTPPSPAHHDSDGSSLSCFPHLGAKSFTQLQQYCAVCLSLACLCLTETVDEATGAVEMVPGRGQVGQPMAAASPGQPPIQDRMMALSSSPVGPQMLRPASPSIRPGTNEATIQGDMDLSPGVKEEDLPEEAVRTSHPSAPTEKTCVHTFEHTHTLTHTLVFSHAESTPCSWTRRMN